MQGVWSHEGKYRNTMLAAAELSPYLGLTDKEKEGILDPRRRESCRGRRLLDRVSKVY